MHFTRASGDIRPPSLCEKLVNQRSAQALCRDSASRALQGPRAQVNLAGEVESALRDLWDPGVEGSEGAIRHHATNFPRASLSISNHQAGCGNTGPPTERISAN